MRLKKKTDISPSAPIPYLDNLYQQLGIEHGQEFRKYVVTLISKRHRITPDDWRRMYNDKQFAELIRLHPDLEQLSWQVYECTTDLICNKLAQLLSKAFGD